MLLLLPQGFKEQDRWFDVAVKVAREFMKAHIITSDSDRIAVVFYGSVCLYSYDILHIQKFLSTAVTLYAASRLRSNVRPGNIGCSLCEVMTRMLVSRDVM